MDTSYPTILSSRPLQPLLPKSQGPSILSGPEPVGGIILGDPWHVNWVISEFIFLDLGLKVFGFGPARPRAWPMSRLPFQFLFLRLSMFWGSSKLMVSTQLQESSITFLILPVSEDLKFIETITEGEKGSQKDKFFS